MTSIAELMTHDHRSCDHEFAAAETLAARKDWPAATKALNRFISSLETHFQAEEQELFPRFEAATGMTQGPTQVMRGEHVEMRATLERLASALENQDADEFAGEAETLLIMMQQHNMKEENILYPMCDTRLGAQSEAVVGNLSHRLAREHAA
ncbi:hemerythrin domain-containing protein [Thauera sp.]|uniref:hemerythrin domain-containing protein n=1 Tax=Thauera sp. TaxID=1905334 RepID=UPI000ECD21CC|nr:hemerythrin domain-containing protein [Thauera sp.]HAG76942.1 hemerythrin [Thauera sp.]